MEFGITMAIGIALLLLAMLARLAYTMEWHRSFWPFTEIDESMGIINQLLGGVDGREQVIADLRTELAQAEHLLLKSKEDNSHMVSLLEYEGHLVSELQGRILRAEVAVMNKTVMRKKRKV